MRRRGDTVKGQAGTHGPIVIDPKGTPLTKGQLLSDESYLEARETYNDQFEAGIGAEAVKAMLANIDLEAEYNQLREDIKATG